MTSRDEQKEKNLKERGVAFLYTLYGGWGLLGISMFLSLTLSQDIVVLQLYLF